MKKVKIILPPGIGDIHWAMLKIRPWLWREQLEAEVWINDHDGRPRSLTFLDLLPFITPGEYWRPQIDFSKDINFEVPGFHAALDFTRSIAIHGRDLGREVMPEIPTDWNYPILEPAADAAWADQMAARWGRFVVMGITDYSIFTSWVNKIGLEKIYSLLRQIKAKFNATPILTGSQWDVVFCRAIPPELAIDICAYTTVSRFFALCRRAEAFVGFAGGNGILAQHLNCPTLLFWESVYQNPKFRYDWVDPEKRGTLYRWMEVEQYDETKALDLIEGAMACAASFRTPPVPSGAAGGNAGP